MPQTFDCPACAGTISTEEPPGSRALCPSCQQAVTVPPVVPPEGIPVPEGDAEPLSYAASASFGRPSTGLAVGSLICGLIAVLTGCFPLGIVGIILGIRSMNLCKLEPRRHEGRGVAIAGICLGCASFVSLVVVVSVGSHFREMSRRALCSAYLRSTGSAMYIYATENEDDPRLFPMIGPIDRRNAGAMRIFGGAEPGQVNPDRLSPPGVDSVPSPTVDMWTVIREGDATPRQFICPSTKDMPDPAQDVTAYYDFASAANLSYAYQYQHDPDRPPLGVNSAASLQFFPIMADANPYLKGRITTGIKSDRLSQARGNSLNHGREGQNVLYLDGHAQFEKGPDCGLAGPTAIPKVSRGRDNIYTWHAAGAGTPVDPGAAAPTAGVCNLGGRSDACLVP